MEASICRRPCPLGSPFTVHGSPFTVPRSPDLRPDASPADVGDEGEWAVAVVGAIGIVDEHGSATDVLAGDDAPVTAVLGLVAIVAHHEVGRGRDEERTPVVMRWLHRSSTEP